MDRKIVGVISDTHGLVRPEARKALEGSHLIIHGGDIGKPEVLEALAKIAPVVAVRGNNDRGEWAEAIPETQVVQVGEIRLFVIHAVKELKTHPLPPDIQGVISGHSHRPALTLKEGILFLNPGAAGPRRFGLPVTVARLYVEGTSLEAEIEEILATKNPKT